MMSYTACLTLDLLSGNASSCVQRREDDQRRAKSSHSTESRGVYVDLRDLALDRRYFSAKEAENER